VGIALETYLNRVLKAGEKSKLINSIVQEFRQNKAVSCEIKDVYYTDRRSAVSPNDPLLSIRMALSVEAATVQVIESLETLVREGKEANRRLIVDVGEHRVVNQEGDLLSDEELVKLIWEGRSKEQQDGGRVGLAYGSILYSSWSDDPIAVAITVTSPDVIRRVIGGGSRFLLPETRVRWFSCSVCGENFEQCEHNVGEHYDGKICAAIPRDVQFLEGSIVARAHDTRCKVNDLLVVDNATSVFEWYAFDKVNMLDRTGRINDARKDGLIPREAVEKFRSYFSRRSVGRCRYRVGVVKGRVTSHRKAAKA
jgi:hypothetical protein